MPEIAAHRPCFAIHPVAMAVAAIAGVAVAGTVALWAHYGTTVFYEIIAAGFAACF